jgi:hypothetical protein
MDKINLGDGTQGSGDSGFVGGGKINANYIALVEAILGVTIWSSATSENLDLTTLNTTDKSSIKAAINELLERTKLIDDSLTSSVFKTWSVDKLVATFTQASALADYLQLAGGTLTGTLNGTSASFTSNVGIGGNILADNLSGTNTGDQDLSGYLLNTTDSFTGNLNIFGGNNNSKESFINVKRGDASGEYLKFQTDSTTSNNVSQFVIRRGTDDVDLLSITISNGKTTFAGTILASSILPQSNNVQTITGSTSAATIGADINVVVVDTTVNCTLTISTAVNVASIKVINIGTGSTSFGGNTDVTINNILDGSTLGSEFSATLTKIATNSWIVSE